MNWPRIVLAALALLLYLRSPIDLVPDRLGPIGLLDDLILLSIAMWWVRSRLRAAATSRTARAPAAAAGGTPWSPYVVLGIGPDASAEEINRAYREQMKRYHPDRVADLGTELQQLAHQKSLEIQRAYQELGVKDRRAGERR